jgi:thioredoxin reductase (NADPH)
MLRTAGILETAMTRSETYAVDVAARALYVRLDEAFPALTDTQIARIRRFGTARRFADGELLFEAGKRGSGMFIVLSGHVAVTARDGLGRITPVADQGPGQFVAELGTLADDPTSVADGRAHSESEKPFD